MQKYKAPRALRKMLLLKSYTGWSSGAGKVEDHMRVQEFKVETKIENSKNCLEHILEVDQMDLFDDTLV